MKKLTICILCKLHDRAYSGTRQEIFVAKSRSISVGDSSSRWYMRALWRGNSANIARILLYVAVNFAAHEQWKYVLTTAFQLPPPSTLHASGLSGRHLPPLQRFLAGMLAGITATTLTYPLDLAKATLAVTSKHHYHGLVDVFWQQEGLKALYRGCISPKAVQMITFCCPDSIFSNTADHTGIDDPSSLYKACFGGASGFFGQIVSYPMDIVRRRMQTANVTGMQQTYKSIWATLLYVWRNEGFTHGLYKGISLNWIKGPIAAGITFSLFEIIQIHLRGRFFQTC